MFVIKNMETGEYVRRNLGIGLQRTNTFNHVNNINEATVFGTVELLNWMHARGREPNMFFSPIDYDWQIVEVRKVERPQYEEVKVIG